MAKRDHLDQFVSQARKDLGERLRNNFIPQNLDRGQIVFLEGDGANSLYLVESGVIEANVVHGDGKVYIFHFVFPGDIFGEGVLYGQERYPFSTVARKEASVWKIPKDDLLPAMEADPRFARFLLEQLGRKLELSYVKARCIAAERVEKRVACILLKMLDQEQGIYRNCAEKLDTPLTNRDISGLIGSTEETVSRVMSRLKKEGIIGLQDRQMLVLDREGLMGYFKSL